LKIAAWKAPKFRMAQSVSQAGFTLLELLVVLGIIALLATIAYPQVTRYLGTARTETARAQIRSISTAIELYALDNGSYPPQQIGLSALLQRPTQAPRWQGPYLKSAGGLSDPWGRSYLYVSPGRTGTFDVYSLGRDNKSGGIGEDQDVSNN
jgi:general secretion pathway protein G